MMVDKMSKQDILDRVLMSARWALLSLTLMAAFNFLFGWSVYVRALDFIVVLLVLLLILRLDSKNDKNKKKKEDSNNG